LKNIAAFSEERAKRSIGERAHQLSDADKIKKWEKKPDMTYERSDVIQDLLCYFHTR
jgi:hypothetical protein